VQIAADRGGCSHRCGKPEVEGDLRRLGERTQQDQHHRDRDDRRMCALAQRPGGRRLDELRDREGSTWDDAEHDQPTEHRQPTEGGDDDRLHGGHPGGLPVVVVADQQEAEDGRQLPEEIDDERVVGGDQAEHRPGEGDEDPTEASEMAGVVPEVAPAVDQDERADPADDQRHQPAEHVEPEDEVEAQFGHPRHGLARIGTGEDLAGLGDRPPGRHGRDDGQHPERLASEFFEQRWREHGCHCVGAEQLYQGALQKAG